MLAHACLAFSWRLQREILPSSALASRWRRKERTQKQSFEVGSYTLQNNHTGMMKRKLLFLSFGLLLASCGSSHQGGPLLSVPPSAAAEDYVYVADAAGRIRAIKPDGTEQWSYKLADDLRRQNSDASYDVQI